MNFFINEEFSNAGIYDITSEGADKDGSLVPTLAFNYNRIESNLIQHSQEELEQLSTEMRFHIIKGKAKSISKEIKNLSTGKPLWKLFIWLTLSFLLAEILIIRFWRR